MRPLSPGCGTVSKAQLARLFFKASANGVVTRQPSLAPPASSSATERRESSDSRPATAHPPEPAPTTMKSKTSVTQISPDVSTFNGFPHQPFGLEADPSRYFWQEGVDWAGFDLTRCHKIEKSGALPPFQSGFALVHSPRTRWAVARGCLLRKPSGRDDRRAPQAALASRFATGFSETKACNSLSRGGAAR